MKSRLLLREELRDYFNDRLPTDDGISYQQALQQNARFMLDNHPMSLILLREWGEGYTLFEISMRNGLHLGVVRDILKFCFEYHETPAFPALFCRIYQTVAVKANVKSFLG